MLALGLSADLFAESRGCTAARKWLLRLTALVWCALLYVLLNPAYYQTDVVRLGLFAFAFHQLVAFAPFIKRGGSIGFWHFNKSLFLRFLTAALYSATLYVGLAIAIFGIQELFNFNWSSSIYAQLFAIIFIGFNTLFFLAGVPTRFEDSVDAHYPKGLKIFTQYVLIPLMTIYLGILLVYELKILIDWELPKGVVATLILGYSVFGILSLLLVWPIKGEQGNRWVQLFSKFFYFTLIPLVVLLAFAIYKRVANYGFTEERHILVVLGLWLAGISLYFLIFRKDNIKLIPISLFILALLSTYGPQSAGYVSKASQQARLAKIFGTEHDEDASQRADIIRYLTDTHGLVSLQAFTETDMAALDKSILHEHTDISSYSVKSLRRDTVFALLNIAPESFSSSDYLYVSRENPELTHISGYDYSYKIESYQSNNNEIQVGNHRLHIRLNNDAKEVELRVDGDSSIVFSLAPLAGEIYSAYRAGQLKERPDAGRQFYYPAENMRFHRENTHFSVTLVVNQIGGNLSPVKSPYGFTFEGQLLFKEK